MKRLLFAAALAAVTASVTIPARAADVGVSINIGQPGFYGQIDIGGYPQPRVIYREPRVIQRVTVNRPPIYINVPRGHAKNWRKHCYKYDACGERVYFVQDSWYNDVYVPRYQDRHHDRHDKRGNGHRESKHDRHGKHGDHGRNHD